jgi:hypothetical protein
MRMTRRRHGVPPQPLVWFQNLVRCLGDSVTIRLASKSGQPVAAMMTLTFRETMVYKYGCSNPVHHHLGGMPFLFWQAIEEAKHAGMREMDLGRSDLDQPGLIAFKDRLGATRSTLTYYGRPGIGAPVIDGWKRHTARWLCAHVPDFAWTMAGRAVYRHLG